MSAQHTPLEAELLAALRLAERQFAAISGLAASYPRPSQAPNGRILLELREMPKACALEVRAAIAKAEGR